MKVNSCDNKTNFGWRYPTHENITSLIADEFPKLKKYKQNLTKFVIKPDFDEKGFKGNYHFYYPRDLFKSRKSFMDLSGNNNAEARYAYHIFSFNKYVNQNNEAAMEHAGRALHFLHDVTQPQHIERGSIYKKWKDLPSHMAFEQFVHNNEDIFIDKAYPNIALEYVEHDFLDLFHEAVFVTKSVDTPNNKNNDEWYDIAQKGISNALAVTKEFLINISDILK